MSVLHFNLLQPFFGFAFCPTNKKLKREKLNGEEQVGTLGPQAAAWPRTARCFWFWVRFLFTRPNPESGSLPLTPPESTSSQDGEWQSPRLCGCCFLPTPNPCARLDTAGAPLHPGAMLAPTHASPGVPPKPPNPPHFLSTPPSHQAVEAELLLPLPAYASSMQQASAKLNLIKGNHK